MYESIVIRLIERMSDWTSSSDPVVVLIDWLLHDVVFLHLVCPLGVSVFLSSVVGLGLVHLSYLNSLSSSISCILVSSLSFGLQGFLLQSNSLFLLSCKSSLLLVACLIKLLGLILVSLGDCHSFLLVAKKCASSVLVDLVHFLFLVGEHGGLLGLLHL